MCSVIDCVYSRVRRNNNVSVGYGCASRVQSCIQSAGVQSHGEVIAVKLNFHCLYLLFCHRRVWFLLLYIEYHISGALSIGSFKFTKTLQCGILYCNVCKDKEKRQREKRKTKRKAKRKRKTKRKRKEKDKEKEKRERERQRERELAKYMLFIPINTKHIDNPIFYGTIEKNRKYIKEVLNIISMLING